MRNTRNKKQTQKEVRFHCMQNAEQPASSIYIVSILCLAALSITITRARATALAEAEAGGAGDAQRGGTTAVTATGAVIERKAADRPLSLRRRIGCRVHQKGQSCQ